MANTSSLAQQFSGISMDGLIGGPLQAVADANSKMAASQTKFLIDTCFNPIYDNIDSKDRKVIGYKPVMISMSLSKPVIKNGEVTEKQAVTTFDLPLLTILPINSLGVEKASIDFSMEVKSSSSEDTAETNKGKTNLEGELSGGLKLGLFSVSIKGKASYSSEDSKTHNTHYENSNSAKYSFHVEAGQLPIPKGVNTIIDAFAQSIEPISFVEGEDTTEKQDEPVQAPEEQPQ